MLIRSLRRRPAPIWKERFGSYSLPSGAGKRRIWVHAVSVGEFLAAVPVLEEIRRVLPTHEIVVSCTTSSGYQTAFQTNQRRSDDGHPKLFDHLIYFPIDISRFTLSALQQIHPEAIVIMETELWMNFLWAAKVFDARVIVMNGRISDRSFPRMLKIGWFYKPMMHDIDRALVQTKTDASRFESLGFQNPEVIGNCKFEQAVPSPLENRDSARNYFKIPTDKMLIVVGSTRSEIEEKMVIEALAKVRAKSNLAFDVIHAPRHIERAQNVAEFAIQNGFDPKLRSSIAGSVRDAIPISSEVEKPSPEQTELKATAEDSQYSYWILDSYGELSLCYGSADIAIVGGGFDQLGGQNIIQPLGWGKPVLHGPHMENFSDSASMASQAGASAVASTSDELCELVLELISDPDRRKKMSLAANQLVKANIGAVKKFGLILKDEISKYDEIEAKYAKRREELRKKSERKSR